jgi:hypothetical protein
MKLDIGRVLVQAGGRALTAADLQRAIGRTHQSNVKKAAKELAAAGVLKKVDPERPQGRPGRPPQDAFVFAEGERGRFEGLLEQLEDPRAPAEGEVVVVDTHEDDLEKGEALWRLLSRKGIAPGVRRVEQVELIGEGAGLRFEFDGPGAVGEAMDLMARFQAAELRVRRGRVSQVATTADLRQEARRRTELIQRTREELGTTQTRPRSED